MLGDLSIGLQELKAVMTAMSEGVVVQVQGGAIITWNSAAEQILQMTGDQLSGRTSLDPDWRAIHLDGSDFPGEHHPAMVCLATGEPQHGVIMGIQRVADRVNWISINAQPIFEPGSKRPDRVVCTFADVTTEVEQKRDLLATQRRLELAMDVGNFVFWELDFRAQVFRTNEAGQAMLGSPVDFDGMSNRVWEFVDPADRAMVFDLISAHGDSSEPLRMDHRILLKDGRSIWVRAACIFKRDSDGALETVLGVVHDIDERKRNEDELLVARDAADAANRAKSEFLANISHELRTPMNGVIGVASALEATDLSPGQSEMVKVVVNSAVGLNRLLSDLLDLSKIEAGYLEMESHDFDLAADVARTTRLYVSAAEQKGILLETVISPSLQGRFNGDSGRISQVVSNLLSNAVKFTTQGKVTLRLNREGSDADGAPVWIRLDVEDTGVGFGPENARNLFTRFRQADASITRRFGGTGLGLFLSRQIVEAMGGTITARSTPRVGSIFSVRLPLHRASPDVRSVDAVQPTDRSPDLGLVRSIDGEGPTAQPARLRILLAEDHPTNQKVVQIILQPYPVDLVIANDGAEAVAAFQAETFDLILMDVQMPVMDGLTALREIRKIEIEKARPRTPAAVLSANAMDHHREDSKGAGADLHVAKPVTPDRLLGAINRLLNAAAPANGETKVG